MNGLTQSQNTHEKVADIMGKALLNYWSGEKKDSLQVYSNIADPDVIPIAHFFRKRKDMPEIEQEALHLCRGKILDIGAAAGCHSKVLQDAGMQVTAIDTSKGAVETMKMRGIKNISQANFFEYKDGKFDTLLFLMNGIGICEKLDHLDDFFIQCKELLRPGGQILLDSSDILFMFEEENGSYMIDLNSNYYGEVVYQFGYKNKVSEPFNWLFIDFDLLQEKASTHNLSCEKIFEGPHFDYLARLRIT